jgi:hypothetical protein
MYAPTARVNTLAESQGCGNCRHSRRYPVKPGAVLGCHHTFMDTSVGVFVKGGAGAEIEELDAIVLTWAEAGTPFGGLFQNHPLVALTSVFVRSCCLVCLVRR